MAHLTNFSFEFFMKFSQKMPLCIFYHGAKKSKMTKNPNQGGGGFLPQYQKLLEIEKEIVREDTRVLEKLQKN